MMPNLNSRNKVYLEGMHMGFTVLNHIVWLSLIRLLRTPNLSYITRDNANVKEWL